jgi:hypothetical protein
MVDGRWCPVGLRLARLSALRVACVVRTPASGDGRASDCRGLRPGSQKASDAGCQMPGIDKGTDGQMAQKPALNLHLRRNGCNRRRAQPSGGWRHGCWYNCWYPTANELRYNRTISGLCSKLGALHGHHNSHSRRRDLSNRPANAGFLGGCTLSPSSASGCWYPSKILVRRIDVFVGGPDAAQRRAVRGRALESQRPSRVALRRVARQPTRDAFPISEG